MNWIHFAGAVVGSTVVMSLTDWLFMGTIAHDKYKVFPEVWRPTEDKKGEPNRVLLTSLLNVVTAAAFVWVAQRLALVSFVHALKLAVAIWVIGPLPATVMDYIWIKQHPAVPITQSLGWLARLVVCAGFVAWLM